MTSDYLYEMTVRELARRASSLSPHTDIKRAYKHHRVAKNMQQKAFTSWSKQQQRDLWATTRSTPELRKAYATVERGHTMRNKLVTTAQQQVGISTKSAGKKIAMVGLGITAIGLARKALKARKAQVNLKPTYRQYDVYPEHGNAVVPAHKLNRPFYDDYSGGRTVPRHESAIKAILHKNRLLETRLMESKLF